MSRAVARCPALEDLGPASRSIRRFGLEDRRPSRSRPPQAYGRLWIARTQQASPLDARNTLYRSPYFPRGIPTSAAALLGNWTFVPNRKYKSELKMAGVRTITL